MSDGFISIDSDNFSTLDNALTYVAREIETSNMLKTIELLRLRYRTFEEMIENNPFIEKMFNKILKEAKYRAEQ